MIQVNLKESNIQLERICLFQIIEPYQSIELMLDIIFHSQLKLQQIITLKIRSMKEEGKLSFCYVNLTFVIASITLAAAITLIVILGVYGYVGFTGSIPISLITCTNTYFFSKFGSFLTNMVEVTFISSLFAVLIAAIIFIVMLIWVIAICKGNSPNESISRTSKIVLYILASLFVWASIMPFGYHLTYLIQVNNCTATTNPNQLIGIFIVAAALFALAIILWILLLIAYYRNQDAEQKYRDIYPNATTSKEKQPYQPRKYVQTQQPQPQQHLEHVEYTKENLMESPKRPTQNYYLKQPQPQPVPDYRARPYSKYQSSKRSSPPYLEPKRNQDNRVGSEYFRSADSSKHYLEKPAPVGAEREGVLLNYIRGKYVS